MKHGFDSVPRDVWTWWIPRLDLILLALFLGPSAVRAGSMTRYAEARVATAPADGVVSDCTEAGLVAALAGGGTVTFNCGTTPVTITLASRITIAATTTIAGGNKITLSGGNVTSLFYVTPTVTLNLSELTLAAGS